MSSKYNKAVKSTYYMSKKVFSPPDGPHKSAVRNSLKK